MPQDPTSAWQTPELTRTFLQEVRGAIPGADLQLAAIAKIAERWMPHAARILDLGCGNGVLGKVLLSRMPAARGLLLDFSEPMLAAARANLEALPRASLVQADFSTPEWLSVARPWAPFHMVVSGFAIHHQSDHRKRELYGEIFALLAPEGVFLNLEHVASASAAGEQLFEDFFIDHLHAFHCRSDPACDRREVAATYHDRPDKKENILAPVEAQCRWLREIGFQDVDCFLKVFELALFGGRKASSTSLPDPIATGPTPATPADPPPR